MKKLLIVSVLIGFNQLAFAQMDANTIQQISEPQLTKMQNDSALKCHGRSILTAIVAFAESLPVVKLAMDASSGAILKETNGTFEIVGRVTTGVLGGGASTVGAEVSLAALSGVSHTVGYGQDIIENQWVGLGAHQAGNEFASAMPDAPKAIYNNTAKVSNENEKSQSCQILRLTQQEVGRRARDMSAPMAPVNVHVE